MELQLIQAKLSQMKDKLIQGDGSPPDVYILTWGTVHRLSHLQRLMKAPQFSAQFDKKEEDILIVIPGYAPINKASLVQL